MHFTFYKRLQVIAVLKFCSCSDVGQRGQPLSWWLGRKFLYGLAVGKVAWGLDKLQESEGLQKGVFFVTVFQVRVNGAGEGAGVQRACIRSKGRRRFVSGYMRKIPREGACRVSGKLRETACVLF